MDTSEVVIGRSSLSLADLTVGTTYQAPGMWLAPDGIGRPTMAWSRNYATARDWHGAIQTDARLEQSSIALAIYLAGDSTADVDARFDELQDALWQFTFDLAVRIDGEVRTWAADCADLVPGDYVHGFAAAYVQRVAVSVPIFPIQN